MRANVKPIENIVKKYPFFSFGGGLFYVWKASRKEGKAKRYKDAFLLKIPFMRQIIVSAEVGRFARTLSIMLKNQVKIIPALRIAKSVMGNSVILESFASLEKNLQKGIPFSQGIGESCYISKDSV